MNPTQPFQPTPIPAAAAASEYLDEELSWLAFNDRVLEEALDLANPLLERLRFAAICASNLDEFFAVRMANLRERARPSHRRRDNVLPSQRVNERFQTAAQRAHELVARLHATVQTELLPQMEAEGIKFWSAGELPPAFARSVEREFHEQILPVLTPMAIDAGRPFPMLAHKRLNLAVMLQRKDVKHGKPRFAVVQVPPALQRTITLRSDPDGDDFVLLEDVMQRYIHTLFSGYEVVACDTFRITRKADISVDEAIVDRFGRAHV